VPSLGDRVPDEDIAVQAVHRLAALRASLRRPVVVVGRPHLVRETVLEDPPYPDDEDSRMFLEDCGLSLFSRKVGKPFEDVLCVDELYLVRQVRISLGRQFRKLL